MNNHFFFQFLLFILIILITKTIKKTNKKFSFYSNKVIYFCLYFYTILMNGRIVKANQQSTTYEKAELECLKKLIEITKNK